MSIILKMFFAIFLALFVSTPVESAATGAIADAPITGSDTTMDAHLLLRSSKGRDNKNSFTSSSWVEVSFAPKSTITQQDGSSVELECEVVGEQATINWIRDNNLHDMVDIKSTLIKEPSPTSLVRVRSRLIIEESGSSPRTFSCVGRSGTITVSNSSTIYSVPQSTSHTTELNRGAKKARIVWWYSVLLDFIGANVELPCKAIGQPNPEIYWLDADENKVDGRNHRFRVLPSGSLYISPLEWADMGDYSCHAKNDQGEDSVQSFIYPIATEA